MTFNNANNGANNNSNSKTTVDSNSPAEELTLEQIKTLENILLNLHQQTTQVTNQMSHNALTGLEHETTEKVIDADLATESSAHEMDLRLARFEGKKLQEIDDALLRIKGKNFGLCQECEEPIAFNRLQAIPYTRFCIACERTLESKAKSHQKGHETEVDFGSPLVKQFD